MLESFQNNLSQLVSKPGQKTFLLAVSGGVDSITMAELYRQSNHKIIIAHCNFRLRGKESRADEAFVWHYAKSHKIPFHVKHFDTKEHAVKHKLSVQMAARELRYNWLSGLCKKYKYNYVAIAHNSDDAIETFFINLLRGTGIAGLRGISSHHNHVIRPMLHFSRKEIEGFARKNRIKWREDSSNISDKYERNKIRHHLIPLLEKLQPNALNGIRNTIENLGEVEQVYQSAIDAKLGDLVMEEHGKVYILRQELEKLDNNTIYLYEALKKYSFNYVQASEICRALNSQPGKIFLSTTHRLTIDRKYLVIDHKRGKQNKEKYAVKGSEESISYRSFTMKFKTGPKPAGFKPSSSSQVACLDYEKLEFPLTIRKWEKGDRFYPLGMNHPKKVSDFLIDSKVSVPDKDLIYVLVSGKNIAWIIGHRIDNRFKIAQATKKLYICQIESAG